jgi:hypothetical protein
VENTPRTVSADLQRVALVATATTVAVYIKKKKKHNIIVYRYVILRYIRVYSTCTCAIPIHHAILISTRNDKRKQYCRRRRRNPNTIRIRAVPSAVVACHIYEVFQDCRQQLAQCARPTPARNTWWHHRRTVWTKRATYSSSGGVNNRSWSIIYYKL